MPIITNIEDLRVLHQKRTPKMFYDYADSGSWTESTYRANESDFQKIKLRQRVAVNMLNRTTKTTMVGQDVAMPVALAPTGLTGMQYPDGEILAAQAAEKFGVPFCLSTMSICSIEDVAERTTKPFWFQLYVMKDRKFIERLIERAKVAKCSALVLTLDLQILGQRHKDIKNGLSAPPKLTIPNIINMMTKGGRYPVDYAAGVTAASAVIGPIIPPSIGFIVFGEAMTSHRWIGFGIIWFALAVFTVDAIRHGRNIAQSDE